MKRLNRKFNFLGRHVQQAIRNSSLHLAFTLPVLIQISVAVGLVGYLSFRNGQQAVQVLASQLRREVSARIQGELESYFGDPHELNRLNATAFSNGDLDIERATQGEHLLFQQMKIHPAIALTYCGSSTSGEFFGIFRSPETGQLELSYSNADSSFFRRHYSLDVRGYRQHLLSEAEQTYDARLRPWFKAAVDAEGPVWTDVYIAFTTRLPNITASLPVYDRHARRLLGVCAADVVLPEEFRTFLKQLKIGRAGQAFVVDRQGNLISSSTDEPLVNMAGRNPQFLQATQSKNPQVQESATYLLERFGKFDNIQQNQQLTFSLDRQRQFLEVLPFNDGFGLDWLIVVVVPESEFMGQIRLNTRITILLCALALAIALIVGILLARRLINPIWKLNATVREVAAGHWQHRVKLDRNDELGELAKSVNTMAEQIQQSFDRLEEQRRAFSRFFPPEYLCFLNKQSVTEVRLGDHISKEMTVMFSDIRGFTSMAEKMKAEGTFDFINTYLQRISPTVRTHNGFVVKYMGDGMMAVFPYSVENAIDSAIAQFQEVHDYNRQLRTSHAPFTIEIGIGLHTGHVMAGMVGEPNRIQPDAVSDTVNLAARLEGLSKVYGAALIISEGVRDRLKNPHRYDLRFLDHVIVKGLTSSIAIYEVLDAEPKEKRLNKRLTRANFEAGVKAYSNLDLETAKQLFGDVITQHPEDKTARLYQQRIQELLSEGIPKDWNGIWTLSQKR
ncbi:adenylate/guanylate cyclase domain-containing protein [Oscillatoria sp. CS-180]|uniref:adenylate/guanylate cyclase domain-containing protein n=1 Tax=Oscillatoria sp. CS-180 TaxID=3021720 RepID=UPI002330CE20|nr:adenylate/guanylate cyclase domain-containing protein [Oscillatoria sp. CS-180]MDB9528496.1 adenylate/guanylate cyclase domain-containing protein [Oscillatoria sp. CS-180]